jgi:hypothetical protein
MVFEAPADVKGISVLSHSGGGKEDEQWLYLPSAHRVKRISSANRTGAFMGSEFSFEDLTGNDGRKYTWRLLGTEPCGAQTCWTLEAKPTDPASAYSRRVLRVDTAELRIDSVDFYDRKGAKMKTLKYGDYEKLNDRFWRAHVWTMKNEQSGRTTTVHFTSMKLHNAYTVKDFSPTRLE